jgi:hypothetical protein
MSNIYLEFKVFKENSGHLMACTLLPLHQIRDLNIGGDNSKIFVEVQNF